MSMEIKGKIMKVLPELTGEGKNGPWVKRMFVIETEGQYPKKVQISTFGDKLNVALIKEGNDVNVFFELDSREFNERWYTDVRAWKIELAGGVANTQTNQSNTSNFAQPTPISEPTMEDGGDDLPF